jgi:hypothetical protein
LELVECGLLVGFWGAENEVGMERGDGLDRRRHDGADTGFLLGFRREADVVGDGDDVVSGAEREDIIRDAGDEADDAVGEVRDGDVATELVCDSAACGARESDCCNDEKS